MPTFHAIFNQAWNLHNLSLLSREKSLFFSILVFLCAFEISNSDELSMKEIYLARPGPVVLNLSSYSTQLSIKFTMLINVKMPTNVGILTFISMINTTSERLKARNFFICLYFSFYEQLKLRAQLSWAWKKFYNLLAPFLDEFTHPS